MRSAGSKFWNRGGKIFGAVLFVVVSALAREFWDAVLRRGVSGVWACLG